MNTRHVYPGSRHAHAQYASGMPTLMSGIRRGGGIAIWALRVLVYALLAVLRPLVIVGLAVTALLSLVLCVFYGTLAPPNHFPMGLVLIGALVCAALAAAYRPLMEWLRPQ